MNTNTTAAQCDLNSHSIFIPGFTIPASMQWFGQKLRGFSEVSFSPASILLLFIPPSPLWLQSGAGLHMSQILQRKPHAGRPERLWAVHRLRAAKPGYDSKVYGTRSQPVNPMEAIKPFIFYVWASWLSYCWRRRDTGPTSQEPRWNYSMWIIQCTWGRYLLKEQACLYCPPAVKLKAELRNNGRTQVSSVGCGKHDLIWHSQTQNPYNWSGVSWSPGTRINSENLL